MAIKENDALTVQYLDGLISRVKVSSIQDKRETLRKLKVTRDYVKRGIPYKFAPGSLVFIVENRLFVAGVDVDTEE